MSYSSRNRRARVFKDADAAADPRPYGASPVADDRVDVEPGPDDALPGAARPPVPAGDDAHALGPPAGAVILTHAGPDTSGDCCLRSPSAISASSAR